MKYYIVQRQQEYVLFKVADHLVGAFEKEHHQEVISEGNSIMEALMNFESVKQKENDLGLDSSIVRYRPALHNKDSLN